jgi:DNA segregation ATPase FtsK/SpoIIIE, S-DNA-T family
MKAVEETENIKHSEPTVPSNNQTANLLDSIGNWWLRFERFGKDFLGLALIALALITLLGLTDLTQGMVISPWVFFVRRWLGWGGYLLALAIGSIGLAILWRRTHQSSKIHFGRVLAFEGLAFTIITLLAYFEGQSLERAELGLDGGVIGWALARLLDMVLPPPLGTVVLIILAGVFGYFAFGLNSWATQRLEQWLRSEEDLPQVIVDTPEIPVPEPELVEEEPSVQRQKVRQPRRAGSSETVPQQKALSVRRDERLPPLNLLMQEQTTKPDEENIHATAGQIEQTLAEFGIPARVVGFRVGPTVTQYAVEPGFIEKTGLDGLPVKQKVRISQISALARDLALALSAERLRIEAPVPGQSFVGIEVPNSHNTIVRMRSILESDLFHRLQSNLAIVLGRDVSGLPVMADLTRMPHLLIAGTTGSGKSVCIQALTLCLVMNNTPDELRLAMLDPKMVELIRFNGLPHLLGKVEIESERMIGVLNWAVAEMDNRYRLLETAHARDLETYNRRAARKKQPTLPRIVVLIDELADLMMSAPDQTEGLLVRLAQMARATGIHLVVATQRPSTDVLTGLIKANFPARISFTVASAVDSRVILDSNGAETLLGRGDMLFLNPEAGTPQRCQGVMVTDQEIERVIGYWKKMSPIDDQSAPWEEIISTADEPAQDELVKQAIKIVRSSQHASASMLQRRLRVGYPRAARLIDELETLGVVGPSQPGGREREVLWSPDDVDLGENIGNEEEQ